VQTIPTDGGATMIDLLPPHLADLRASGLDDRTIELMRVSSVEPASHLMDKGVSSALRFPYLELKNCSCFHRDKLFPPPVDENGKIRKYDQPPGTGCRLYVLEPTVDLLGDYTKPLFFVEGEKKTAAGYQAGLGCVVGVGGIWNFLDKTSGELIPEFDRIAWRSREVFYIPDSDVWSRQDLQQAVFEFGSKVRERGGLKFYFIQIPPGSDGKRGLDDFLLTETVEDLMRLPKLTLNGPGWARERIAHKVREKKRKETEPNDPVEEEQAIPQELIDKAMTTRQLIEIIDALLRRFVFLKDARLYLLIALWTLATYIHQKFEYMPYLWVTSPAKRAGKTRLLEFLREITDNPTAIWVNPTEAILFRSAHRGKTLILDEMERLRQKDKDIFGAVMAVLNSGFQKGGSVPRMVKGKDGTLTEGEWSTYSPKVISGIASVADTIADRSFVIKMVRRVRSKEKLDRFRRRKLAKEFGDTVCQLKIWAAARADVIEKIYESITDEPADLRGCDDRFLDIAEPLLAIAVQADAESPSGISDRLVALLKSIGEGRDDSQDDPAIQAAVEVLVKLLGDQDIQFARSADVLKSFQAESALAWVKSTRSLGGFLSKLGMHSRRDPTGTVRGYDISRSWVQEITERYASS
jgi:Domain of unknown function (DUF3854)